VLLLQHISRHSEQKLNPITFEDGQGLLGRNPELMEMLKVAWAKSSFEEIRQLGSSP
jgi:hypothetical protein